MIIFKILRDVLNGFMIIAGTLIIIYSMAHSLLYTAILIPTIWLVINRKNIMKAIKKDRENKREYSDIELWEKFIENGEEFRND